MVKRFTITFKFNKTNNEKKINAFSEKYLLAIMLLALTFSILAMEVEIFNSQVHFKWLNDLKRWGIAEEVLSEICKFFPSYNYLYPIPQGEIDRSGGQMEQNPGY